MRAYLFHDMFDSESEHPALRAEAFWHDLAAIRPLEERFMSYLKEHKAQAWPYDQQLQQACEAGVLTEHEVEQLRQAHKARRNVIDVDDFSAKELRKKS